MKTVVALVAFLLIFVPLNSAIGGPLKCKKGSAISLEGTDRSEILNCSTPNDEYCVEATCTAWDQHGNFNKFWDCVVSRQGGECAFYKQTMEERTNSKNVSCDCRYGENGKPSSAATNRNEHVQTMWGCSKDTSGCDALNVAVSAKIDAAVKCECSFGEKGVPKGIKHFPISTTTMPMTTISEENRSARRSFAIIWTLLVAIGILA
uniref:Uncharacterized protein n=1 Tax=Globodera rostochiensis TaxID=31243 RepID=A0A914H9A6_GLORO